jgi:hypothetical protein
MSYVRVGSEDAVLIFETCVNVLLRLIAFDKQYSYQPAVEAFLNVLYFAALCFWFNAMAFVFSSWYLHGFDDSVAFIF